MFETFIMVCALLTGQCTEFKDIYGPYPTEEECEIRAYEMVTDIDAIFENMELSFGWKCKYDGSV